MRLFGRSQSEKTFDSIYQELDRMAGKKPKKHYDHSTKGCIRRINEANEEILSLTFKDRSSVGKTEEKEPFLEFGKRAIQLASGNKQVSNGGSKVLQKLGDLGKEHPVETAVGLVGFALLAHTVLKNKE
jgi:hypothetical protein